MINRVLLSQYAAEWHVGERMNDMNTAKQEVEQMLHQLPDNSSFEDIQYHLYVLDKVHRGIDRIEKEGGVSQEDAEKRLSKWLIK